jgi:hypothetical protein
MNILPKYKKIEVTIFGLVAPILLAAFTFTLLLQHEAVFWGRNLTVIYHGREALFVSLFWFGISSMMFSCFFLRPLELIKRKKLKIILYLSLALIVIGLASVIAMI